MVEIIGAPWDGCGYRSGSRLGPAAVRLAALAETLASLGVETLDRGDIAVFPESTVPGGIRNFEPAFRTYSECKRLVIEACDRGAQVIVLGGDHSNSIGSIAGALTCFGDELAVLWIDAHMDLNSPSTSPSGNLHGMPLGALTHRDFVAQNAADPRLMPGVADVQWNELIEHVVGSPRLDPSSIGWFAVRDVDRGEQEEYHSFEGSYMATMYDIDRNGIVAMVTRVADWLKRVGATKLWISFDVDCLDPYLAPGTGTAVRGGLTYREMHLMGEMLHEILHSPDGVCQLAGIDIVEVNPIADSNNVTARTAVEWVGSVFGKTIFGRPGASL